MTPEPKPAPKQPPARLQYSPPTLVTYGDAVELTQGRSTTGARPDGGAKVKMRTN